MLFKVQEYKLLTTFFMLISLLLSFNSFAESNLLGDVSPRGNVNGRLDFGDYLLLKRFVDGDATPTASELIALDLAPAPISDDQLNFADMIVLRQLVLDYEFAASQVVGNWLGTCRENSPGEYQLEELSITYESLTQSFKNSSLSDCSNPWITVTKLYTYTVTDSKNIKAIGALLDLSLIDVFIYTNTIDVSDALNISCSRTDIAPSQMITSNGVSCNGNVQYPLKGTLHYQRVKVLDNKLYLGDEKDVGNVIDRAVTVSQDRVFTKIAVAGE